MRFISEILAVSSLVAPLVAAHGEHIPGAPKIWGLGPKPMHKLKSRNFIGPVQARRAALPRQGVKLNKRQGGQDGRCGPDGGNASCDEGYCCSSAGWCGQGTEYCAAPDCLFQYGPACDANHVPSGTDTRNIARPQLGDIPYGGEGVYTCSEPGTVAITYDDGPYVYTHGVLDLFKAAGAKATFFITGINIGKGAIDDAGTAWPAVISRMIAEGHQVASHTWSHQDLSVITQEQRINQMVRNEMAIRNIIGKFPTYMRPPYSSCTPESGCQSDLANLGYVVSYFNLDTDDYNNVTPELIQNAKDNFYKAINPSNSATDDFLAIAHDIHQQTAQNLTGYMLDLLKTKGYKAVTMGECLGDPEANWYRDSAGTLVTSSSVTPSATVSGTSTSVAPTATPTAVSPDGTCGGSTGYTCIGFEAGSCCSPYGWCGSSADHCGTGCNPLFGNCGSSVSSSSAVPSSPAASSPATSPSAAASSSPSPSPPPSPSSTSSSQVVTSPPGSSSAPVSTPTPTPTARSTISTSVRPSSTTKSSVNPSATANVSTNGKCGANNNGMTCKGYSTRFGGKQECCRRDGTCENNIFACGMGCQKKYGICWW